MDVSHRRHLINTQNGSCSGNRRRTMQRGHRLIHPGKDDEPVRQLTFVLKSGDSMYLNAMAHDNLEAFSMSS
jgi:hypothetical protein